jgi:hypothetical protein
MGVMGKNVPGGAMEERRQDGKGEMVMYILVVLKRWDRVRSFMKRSVWL